MKSLILVLSLFSGVAQANVAWTDMKDVGLESNGIEAYDIMAADENHRDPWIRLSTEPEIRRMLVDMREAKLPVEPSTLVGPWKCQTLIDAKFIYTFFDCKIESLANGDLYFTKVTGSQNFTGTIKELHSGKDAVFISQNQWIGSGVVVRSASAVYLVLEERTGGNRILKMVR